MNIIIFGPPGSGKGTQSKLIEKKISAHHISTGDIIRDAIQNNMFNKNIKKEVISGKLIQDTLMIKTFFNYLKKKEFFNTNKDIWLFDGIPRNLLQAKILNNYNINFNSIIDIFIEDKIILKRLEGRLTHEPSGRIYNIYNNPPKNKNKDDLTGENLTKRHDDNSRTISRRLKVYYKNYNQLLNFYKNILKIDQYFLIDGIKSILDIHKNIMKKLSKIL